MIRIQMVVGETTAIAPSATEKPYHECSFGDPDGKGRSDARANSRDRGSGRACQGIRRDLDRRGDRGSRPHQERLLLPLQGQERARPRNAPPLCRDQRSSVRRHLRARPPIVRRSAAGVPDFAEAARRNHGRSAERPSGLPDREHLLSGAAVRSRGARTHRAIRARLERALPRFSTALPRSIRRGSRSISTMSPTCCPASSTAPSSCRRR